jgi:hypothetical protein
MDNLIIAGYTKIHQEIEKLGNSQIQQREKNSHSIAINLAMNLI